MKFEKLHCINLLPQNHRFWLFWTVVSTAIIYLILLSKTTDNLDQITTDSCFWLAIMGVLKQKKDELKDYSEPISSSIGFLLLGLILSKAFTLFEFESDLLSLLPFGTMFALALIASGFRGLSQYRQELFFAWFLFFPIGVLGQFLDRIIHLTILNAKCAAYVLYYLGFNVTSKGNQVILNSLEFGQLKAVVDYPCAGMPMILLMLKLALLLICLNTFTRYQQLLIPLLSIFIGFCLGAIRVCILTLLIPNHTAFNYWHGATGSQIFSTIPIIIFAGFCYGISSLKSKSMVN